MKAATPSRKRIRFTAAYAGFAVSALTAANVLLAQGVPAPSSAAGLVDPRPGERGWVTEAADSAKATYARISKAPDWDVYLSGYARHGRRTYSRERIGEFNEQAWGVGFGKTLRDAQGNDESLFALAISDSHWQPQVMAGYVREWIWPIARTGVEVGVGYTAMLMSRQDFFGGFPFPVALPAASIGTQKARLMAAYVPRISKNKGNGDVLLLLGRFTFD